MVRPSRFRMATRRSDASRRLLGLASRFGVVGVAATLTYLAVANLLIHFASVGPGISSVLAYLAGMAVSYIGQSRWTFQGAGSEGRLARFVILSLVGLMTSFVAPLAAVRVGCPAAVGTAVPVLAVPLLSFVAMKWWVFSNSRASGEPCGNLTVGGTVHGEEHRPSV